MAKYCRLVEVSSGQASQDDRLPALRQAACIDIFKEAEEDRFINDLARNCWLKRQIADIA